MITSLAKETLCKDVSLLERVGCISRESQFLHLTDEVQGDGSKYSLTPILIPPFGLSKSDLIRGVVFISNIIS